MAAIQQVLVAILIRNGEEDAPRIFSSQEKADAWAATLPDECSVLFFQATVDDPDELTRRPCDYQ